MTPEEYYAALARNTKLKEQQDQELTHWGILGMHWGQRRYQNEDGTRTEEGKRRYKSTSLRGAIARKHNEKVDKGFKKWKEGAKNREDAKEKGSVYVDKRLAYEANKNKLSKAEYKTAKKDYKAALKSNTTYRKGQVEQETYSKLSRNYLSQAKKVEKQLKADPNNKALQKKYNQLMTDHDVYREKARRAPSVAEKRSRAKANIKRALTMTVTAAASAFAIKKGVDYYNKATGSNIELIKVSDFVKGAKKAGGILDYVNY